MWKIKLHRYWVTVMFLFFNVCWMYGQNGFISDTIVGQLVNPGLMFRPNLSGMSNQIAIYKKFDPSELPLFCKIEHKIETGSKIAFRFRIGDLNYVNLLENKR